MENIITIQDRLYPALAKEKITNQLATFTGGAERESHIPVRRLPAVPLL